MSKITLAPNASGTGTLTIAAPNTNSDYTLTLPSATGTVNTSGSVNEVPAGSAGSPSIYSTGDSNTGVFFPAADTVAVTTGGSERMRVTSGGLVGIGTTPAKLFHAYRNNTDQDAQVQVEQAGSGSPTLGFLKTGVYSWLTGLYNSDNSYRIAASGTDLNTTTRLTIDTAGNVLVGTTSTNPNPGVAILQSGAIAVGNNAGLNGYTFHYFQRSGSTIGSITQNGTTATAYNTSSDYRLKENVQPMVGALDKIALLNPVTYNWKSDGSDGQGFIAHELQAVVPDCVTGEKDAVDEEGNPKHQGVDTSFLVATLVAAIQEQQQMIQALQADIAALKGV